VSLRADAGDLERAIFQTQAGTGIRSRKMRDLENLFCLYPDVQTNNATRNLSTKKEASKKTKASQFSRQFF
jgi:hypothetical protein